MSKKHKKTNNRTINHKNMLNKAVMELNITDFDMFYEDVILTYNGIRPSNVDFINRVCTVGNGSGLKEFLTDVEFFYDVTLDAFGDRIFKHEITEFFNILETHIGVHNTDVQDIINIAFDNNSTLNIELSKHDITKYIIIVKSLYTHQMRKYDPNYKFHKYVKVVSIYDNLIDMADMTSSLGYGISTPFVELSRYLDTYKRLPLTRREWASTTSHPWDY